MRCISKALKQAFEEIEAQVVGVPRWMHQGSTASLAMVVEHPESGNASIVTANVGDARVVLSRRGEAVELTEDHKPNSPTELARIEAAGGLVEWFGITDPEGLVDGGAGAGVYRVNRNLAVARAIGDASEKPYVSPEPDIRVERLQRGNDEFLVIATDGLWDVMSSEDAVEFVHGVMSDPIGALREGHTSSNSTTQSRAALAAMGKERPAERRITDWSAMHPSSDRSMIRAVLLSRRKKMARYLCEEAIRLGTTDNITVVVVWLTDEPDMSI